MVEACGAPADFEALLVAQQVSYEYCAPLWSEAVATGLANTASIAVTSYGKRGASSLIGVEPVVS